MKEKCVCSDIAITDEEFEKFREFFYRKTGIMFDESKRYFVDRRLIERIKATGHNCFKNYFIFLRFEATGKELQNLINVLTVNETYFFREEYQFQCMVKRMLPEIMSLKKRGDMIRIWSIPSSTGEEPYSIAIYLLEYWSEIDKWDVEIISSDIDTNVLEQAKRGIYAERSVKSLPDEIIKKYFKTLGNGYFKISDELISSVEFTRVNLVDRVETKRYRGFDIVFCRNLLIYFDDASRKVAAENLYDAMNPGAFICLGHSESMSRISPIFHVRKFPEAIVYQKPLEEGR
ncbi:CheR family methyltransferase [Thermodesulfovibrio yellowstonii]|uniref:protein-glutamate O-methyltransferase n=1 Tax=Thermodesulfovibrio yellowstonii TaxID=28262 RepID=A0A9W6GD23_9BACT|nr:protein-glutamate O-methyltransferase CheR [Thermodesulfovibrio islandicus]GLI52989.1 chemotaxis protein methyltransferase 2 [Thermodesulfovibrio islandicus]